MNVTKHIICELTGYRPGAVDVSQGDRGSRAVSCRLLESGAPWMIPEGSSVRVAYTLPDGTEGLYDALPDGSPAGETSGNTVTVELADQLMDQAGMVQASILIIGPEGGQLATWPIRVMVSANRAARLTVPENMPPYGAGFAGKIFFGGADGTVTPLELGDGVEIVRQEDGSYALVACCGAGGGIQEETDPTVPDWAKQANKPSYTAQEVGALPAGTRIPTKTSDLSNDSGFITKSVGDLVNYYTKTQTEELIAQIPKFRVEVVQQLPAAGEDRVLYLVPFATAEGQYLEYVWVGGRFEVIGSQKVDLTGYATQEWVQDYVEEHAGQNPGLSDEDMTQIVDGVTAELLKPQIISDNIYDETTAVDFNNGYTGVCKRGTVALPADNEVFTVWISTAGKSNKGYIYLPSKAETLRTSTIVVYTDNGDIVNDIVCTEAYSTGATRFGVGVTIPSGANASRIEFLYRVAASSGAVLCQDMMVTIGDSVPAVYEEYKETTVLEGLDYLTPEQGDERYTPKKRCCYVSTSGNDDNDGLTKETALASIKKALLLGARELAVEAGEYFISTGINMTGLNDIHIYAYRNGEEYSHTAPQRDKVKITGATYYSGYSLNSDGVYQQNNVVAGFDFATVFTNASKNPTVTDRTYHANVMVIHDDTREDYYLKPVLTYAECVSAVGTFYWDGSTLFFNSASTDFVRIAVIMSEVGLTISGCNNVVLDDICVGMTKGNVITISDSTGVVMNNCEASASATNMGFAFTNANGVLNNCYATKNAYDGFNFHGYGTTVMNDCHAENNYDDGCSHHDGCIGTINGGRFSGSGKAGIAPAYGAKVNIYNAVCDDNKIGIGYLTTANGHAPMTGIVSSCAMLNNKTGLEVNPLCSLIAIDCKYSGNETDKEVAGTIKEC